MNKLLIIPAAILLTGCFGNTPEPQVRTVFVDKPVFLVPPRSLLRCDIPEFLYIRADQPITEDLIQRMLEDYAQENKQCKINMDGIKAFYRTQGAL